MLPEKRPNQSIGPAAMLAYGLLRCPFCDTYFYCKGDLNNHISTHWKPARNGGEWMPSETDPYTAELLRSVGTMIKNGYRYALINNGRVIYRKMIFPT